MSNIVSVHDIPTNCLYGLYSNHYNDYCLLKYGIAEQGPSLFAEPTYQNEANVWLAGHPDEHWAAHIFTKKEIEQMIQHLEYIRDNMED